MRWIDEITSAFHKLGGAARYADLYEYLVRTTERELSREWKQRCGERSKTIRAILKIIDQTTSFKYWGTDTGASVARSSRRKNWRAEKSFCLKMIKEVFVRQHWRSLPQQMPDETDFLNDDRLSPSAAWCSNSHLEVMLNSGTKLTSPIAWYPRLTLATAIQRAHLELSPYGIHWPEIDEDISIKNLLLGMRGIEQKRLK